MSRRGPGMFLTTGRLHLEFGPNGIKAMRVQGQAQDVCALLAAA